MGRLAGLDAGLHQLHVRLHVLDTRVVQLTQGLRQLREAAGDTRDALQALQEAQSRSERERGRLEGKSAPRGAGKTERSGSGKVWGPSVSRARGFLETWGVLADGEVTVTGRVNARSRQEVGRTRSRPRG